MDIYECKEENDNDDEELISPMFINLISHVFYNNKRMSLHWGISVSKQSHQYIITWSICYEFWVTILD